MPFDYSSIMQAQWERLESEHAQAVADLEAARHREDSDATMYAAERVLEIDGKKSALAQRANQYVARQAPPMPGAEDLSHRDVIKEARIIAKHDQYQMPTLVARWMSEDRRFDAIRDKVALAKEAMDCKSHGRELDLSGRLRIDTEGATSAPISGWR